MKILDKLIYAVSFALVGVGFVIDLLPNLGLRFIASLIFYFIPLGLITINMIIKLYKVKDKEERDKIRKKDFKILFIIYCLLLISLLFFNGTYRRMSYREISFFSQEHIENYTNLIPFKTIGSYIERIIKETINTEIVLVNLLGNIVAFSGFGFFIPMLDKNKKISFLKFVLFVAEIIIAVEFIQFLTLVGAADIDDLILNLLGAVIVYLLVVKSKLIKKLLVKLKFIEE